MYKEDKDAKSFPLSSLDNAKACSNPHDACATFLAALQDPVTELEKKSQVSPGKGTATIFQRSVSTRCKNSTATLSVPGISYEVTVLSWTAQ